MQNLTDKPSSIGALKLGDCAAFGADGAALANTQSASFKAAHAIAEKVCSLPRGELAPSCTEARAYIVGGWCRDTILQRPCTDVDIEVFGLDRTTLAAALKNLFGTRVIQPSGNPLAPFKVVLKGGEVIDVVLPIEHRRDAPRSGEHLVQAPHISLQEDAGRRDFTCNAVYFDPLSASFLDPVGGVRDISEGTLRLIPGTTEQEINAGIPLRACRLACELGFSLEPFSREALATAVARGAADRLPKDLFTAEFIKMLVRPEKPSGAFRLASELGILPRYFPELERLTTIPQDPRHHPEGNVFEHTMLVIDAAAQLSRDLAPRDQRKVLLAALLHDIGKLTTTKTELVQGSNGDGMESLRVSAHNNEIAGVKIARKIFERLSLAPDVENQVIKMIRHHMRPLQMQLRFSSDCANYTFDNHVRQLVRDVFPAKIQSFLVLCLADRLGRPLAGEQVRSDIQMIERIRKSVERNSFDSDPTNRLLRGIELKEMGFTDRAKSFQRIFEFIEKKRDAGVVKTQDQARMVTLMNFALCKEEVERAGIVSPEQKQLFYFEFKSKIRHGELRNVADCRGFLAERTIGRG